MKKGFSLIELTIAITIIAVIMGLIAGASRIYEVTALRGLVKEVQTMRSAVDQFISVYGQYPGDFDNAYTVLGSANSCTDADVNSDAAGCNGDGDGTVEWSEESYRSNQHLWQSGLWQGAQNGTSEFIKSEFKSAIYHPITSCSTLANPAMGVNCSQLGSSSDKNAAILTPAEHRYIDSKLDDGLPLSGSIRFQVVGAVTTGTCGSATAYALTSQVAGCNLLFTVGPN
jgi:prepilin-type N-terminal cleavage/methylation domain-containing protein